MCPFLMSTYWPERQVSGKLPIGLAKVLLSETYHFRSLTTIANGENVDMPNRQTGLGRAVVRGSAVVATLVLGVVAGGVFRGMVPYLAAAVDEEYLRQWIRFLANPDTVRARLGDDRLDYLSVVNYAKDERMRSGIRALSRVPAGWNGACAGLRSESLGELPLVSVVAITLFACRMWILQPFVVTSNSMAGAFLPGDCILVNRTAAWASGLGGGDAARRGEVWVISPVREGGTAVIKRLVGVPGDTLTMKDGQLYLGDRVQSEVYATTDQTGEGNTADFGWQRRHLCRGHDLLVYTPTLRDWGPLVVPANSYFALGDNRARSRDHGTRGLSPKIAWSAALYGHIFHMVGQSRRPVR